MCSSSSPSSFSLTISSFVLSSNETLDLISVLLLPGTGSQGTPWNELNCSKFHLFSYSAFLLTVLALTTPSGVPMMISSLSSLEPSQIPSCHLSSNLSVPFEPKGSQRTHSPNSVMLLPYFLPFHLWYAVLPSSPILYLVIIDPEWATSQGMAGWSSFILLL